MFSAEGKRPFSKRLSAVQDLVISKSNGIEQCFALDKIIEPEASADNYVSEKVNILLLL